MNAAARDKLLMVLRTPTPEMRQLLEQYKRDGERELRRLDFLWHALLQSFATMGNSRGAKGLIENQERYARVTFPVLASLSSVERLARLEETLAAAGVRMPKKKAVWLATNFNRIQAMGGLQAASEQALAQPGTVAKIAFLKQFDGIGDKYARNIWMDAYA